ncbi:TraR/DksA C4-type zinc finger protein [Nostoc sp. WHI]|jgi:Fe2+ or Zn2+ uptake regulation protein|uniref:TraR/DksA C4-type zinc finger protein n=1 Tax=Nostoc sp. WHI TaxID=2650611 RepID=UPI0018C503D0|nr:TraR/DksA C4-type zinc finger protein [Nostoc sp. WHI]MBG1266961.1 TraR/DksA family transcriptional regulator [Nostoc sp. WHI]
MESDQSSTNYDFVFGLKENALDSLVHAVEHLLADEKDTDLKYTVLHVFHAAELFLKARLAAINYDLIYTDSKKTGEDDHTITINKAKERLKNNGVILSRQDLDNLEELRKVRNRIEHHRITGSRKDIEQYVGRAMDFLDIFLRKELKINLKDALDQLDEDGSTYKALSLAWFSYIRRMAEEGGITQHRRSKEGYDFFICEECGEEAIAFPDPTLEDGTVHCFSCQSRYSVDFCLRCTHPTLSLIEVGTNRIQAKRFDEDNWCFCDSCKEDIADLDE